MKRSGFTMIELIFVIVILGILAAVAIPKLAATRDDAKISKGASELATLVSDMGAYYTAQGEFSKISEMTNVKMSTDEDMSDGGTVYYRANGTDNCIMLNASQAAAEDGNFTLKYAADDTSAVCKGIADAADEVTGGTTSVTGVLHKFGGSNVNFD